MIRRIDYVNMIYFFDTHKLPKGLAMTLVDVPASMLFNRLILNLVQFDDYIHQKYGDYETQGKSLSDMFKIIFKEDYKKACEYFGLEVV